LKAHYGVLPRQTRPVIAIPTRSFRHPRKTKSIEHERGPCGPRSCSREGLSWVCVRDKSRTYRPSYALARTPPLNPSFVSREHSQRTRPTESCRIYVGEDRFWAAYSLGVMGDMIRDSRSIIPVTGSDLSVSSHSALSYCLGSGDFFVGRRRSCFIGCAHTPNAPV